MSETLETKVRRIGDDVTAAWDIIRANGGVLPHKINTENLADILPQAVNINKWLAKGAFLYNYNGTFYDFYTKHEVEEMTELPPLPTGATGWPKTLAQLKVDMASSNYLVMIADGSYTEDFTIDLDLTDPSLLSPTVFFKIAGNPEDVVLRWGDGSAEIFTAAGLVDKQHTYSSTGTYTVTISVAGNDTIVKVGLAENVTNTYSILSYNQRAGTYSYKDFVGDIFVGSKIELGPYAFAVGASTSQSAPYVYSSVENVAIQNFPTIIPNGMYKGAAFSTFLIPQGVTDINNEAFAFTRNLTTVRGDDVVNIGGNAFSNCSNLSTADFPSCISVGSNAFDRCYNLVLSSDFINRLTSISSNAFSGAGSSVADYRGTLSYVAPSNDAGINTKAFSGFGGLGVFDARNASKNFEMSGCQYLREYKFSQNASTLPSSMFSYCYKLEKAIIPEGVTELPYQTFYQAGGSNVPLEISLPSTLTTLASYSLAYVAYNGASIEIEIPASVTTINGNAMSSARIKKLVFAGQMPNLSAGNAVTVSGGGKIDLSNCTTIPTLANTSCFNVNNSITVILPDALYDQWIVSPVWSNLTCVFVKASQA